MRNRVKFGLNEKKNLLFYENVQNPVGKKIYFAKSCVTLANMLGQSGPALQSEPRITF